MSARTARNLVAGVMAFALLVGANDCGGTTFSNIVSAYSTVISVRNNSPEAVMVALYADDAFNTGVVPPAGNPTITTHIEGTYSVVVSGSSEQASQLNATLASLRAATRDIYAARASGTALDTSKAPARAAEAKQVLGALKQPQLALVSCTGTTKFPRELSASPRPMELNATITRDASGAWAAVCPSTP